MSPRRGIARWTCTRWTCGLPTAALALTLTAPAAAQPADEQEETVILSLERGRLVAEGEPSPLPWARSSFGPLIALAPVVAALGGELDIGPLGEAHTLRVDGREVVLGPLGRAVTVDGAIHRLSIRPWLETAPPRRGADRLLYVPVDALSRAYPAALGYRFDFDQGRGTLRVDRAGERRLAVEVDRVHDLGVTTLVVTFSDRPRYRVEQGRGSLRLRLLSGVMTPRSRIRLNDPLARWLEVRKRSIDIGLAPRVAVATPYLLGRPPRVQLVLDMTRERPGRAPRTPSRREENAAAFSIVLDPGHGGADTGLSSPLGTEKDLVLEIARELQSHLEDELGARVALTRTDDSAMAIENRTAVANQRRADLFLSLHLSAHSDRAVARGFQAHVLDPRPARFDPARSGGSEGELTDSDAAWGEPSEPTAVADDADAAPLEDDPALEGDWAFEGDPAGEMDDRGVDGAEAGDVPAALEPWDRAQDGQLGRSEMLARLIQSHVSDALGQANRQVGRAPLRVLTGAAMPAVLLELGSLGGGAETPLLDASRRRELIEAIGRAIRIYRIVAGAAGGRGEMRRSRA